jgi:hypothetical protein
MKPAQLSATAETEIRTSVQETLDAFRDASASGEWNEVIAFYLDSPEFRWTEQGGVQYRSVEEIRKSLTSFPAGTRIVTTYTATEITPLAPDSAQVVTRFATRVAIPQSGGFKSGGTLTLTLVRRDGAWRFAEGRTTPAASAGSTP